MVMLMMARNDGLAAPTVIRLSAGLYSS